MACSGGFESSALDKENLSKQSLKEFFAIQKISCGATIRAEFSCCVTDYVSNCHQLDFKTTGIVSTKVNEEVLKAFKGSIPISERMHVALTTVFESALHCMAGRSTEVRLLCSFNGETVLSVNYMTVFSENFWAITATNTKLPKGPEGKTSKQSKSCHALFLSPYYGHWILFNITRLNLANAKPIERDP
uniref:Uncharacterized protein n=1 Tax=Glossina austeni TaxID=7395 RepID=A0A1A9UV30_GLOAU